MKWGVVFSGLLTKIITLAIKIHFEENGQLFLRHVSACLCLLHSLSSDGISMPKNVFKNSCLFSSKFTNFAKEFDGIHNVMYILCVGRGTGKSRGTVRDKCLDSNTTQEHCLCYPEANPAAILLFLYFDLVAKQSTLTLKNKFHLW